MEPLRVRAKRGLSGSYYMGLGYWAYTWISRWVADAIQILDRRRKRMKSLVSPGAVE